MHEVAGRRLAQVRVGGVRRLPYGSHDDADGTLGSNGERALRRLAVDDDAICPRHHAGGKRFVRRVGAIVGHLFADDEQQRTGAFSSRSRSAAQIIAAAMPLASQAPRPRMWSLSRRGGMKGERYRGAS
jgi:hypothetical protein